MEPMALAGLPADILLYNHQLYINISMFLFFSFIVLLNIVRTRVPSIESQEIGENERFGP